MNSDNYRPNIIFVHAESMDGRKMGCMGNPAMKSATPNLDRLANQGVLFTNAYSNCPVCNPSRASMWSGKYPHYYECWNNHEGITEDVPTFFTRLEEAGYLTNAIGPLDYLYGKHSIRDRVGSWTRAANIHRPLCRSPLPSIVKKEKQAWGSDRNRTSQAIDWLQQASSEDSPFMLYLTTGLVHPAFVAQEKYLNLIDEEKIEIPPHDDEDHPVLNYQWATKNCQRNLPEEIILKIRKIYFAMIATLDEMFGELMKAVDRLGLNKSTYVIFSSDHGEMAMEHSQILKRTMYEPVVHEPLIISGPDVRKGVAVETPVSLIDIFPTLMDMARAKHPEGLDGESLMPELIGQTDLRRDWVFSEYHGDRCNTGTFMLRRGDWKQIKYMGYEPLLFNLKEDSWEINNLAEKRTETVNEMDDILRKIVNLEAVDAKAKAYDKLNFRRWREKQIKRGTYEITMAKIYSGYNRLCIEDIMPWTKEDEELILKWLEDEN